MTPEERASVCLRDLDKCGPEHVRHQIIQAIREAYEDAARIVDARANVWFGKEGKCSLPLQEECEDIAAAIRARMVTATALVYWRGSNPVHGRTSEEAKER
jgi:hypothetical protein